MANIYRWLNSIASTLQEFQTGIPVILQGNPNQIYIDLAWGGLTNTTYFNNMYSDDPNHINYDDRQRILARIIAEKLGSQYGVTTPLGTPCK